MLAKIAWSLLTLSGLCFIAAAWANGGTADSLAGTAIVIGFAGAVCAIVEGGKGL